MDGRTDGQTEAMGKTICLPTLAGGRHNNLYSAYRVNLFIFQNEKYYQNLSNTAVKTCGNCFGNTILVAKRKEEFYING